jgi:hypothetical protein
MAGLSKLILPRSARSAADVAADFNSLRDVVNDLRDNNLEPGAVNTRHLLDRRLSSPTLPFKKVWRKEFSESNINDTAYAEVVAFASGVGPTPPRLYSEDTVVFVVAELVVYHTSAATTPITTTSTDSDVYGFYLDFVESHGPSPPAWGGMVPSTTRYVTPGSASANVFAEMTEVVLFGFAPVAASSTNFNARVMAKSFGQTGVPLVYDLTSDGSDKGRVSGAITALVIAR